jgi:hypothetical protein
MIHQEVDIQVANAYGLRDCTVGLPKVIAPLRSVALFSLCSTICPQALSAGNTHSRACIGYSTLASRMTRTRQLIITRDKGTSKAFSMWHSRWSERR